MTFTERILRAIRSVPPGQVASYGLIGAIAGSPRSAQAVGQILHNYSEKQIDLPWWRIINARGYITTPCLEHPAQLQASLLKSEGVTVEQKNNMFWVDMQQFGYHDAAVN